MSQSAFEQAASLRSEMAAENPTSLEELEAFRIAFLGSKNRIKPLFGLIRDIPNEKKKEFGQLLNEIKTEAEEKFERRKRELSAEEESKAADKIDLTAPAYPYEQGARHPISLALNRIIDIFSRIGFEVVEEREIED